jgi:hypothetical protein
MYNVKMINQTLVHGIIMKDNSMSLQTILEETPAVVAHFDLKVLCKGCNEENSFALIYPASFGRNTNKSFRSVDGGDAAREDNGALDAAKILIAIEEAAKTSVLSIKAFEEVKIAVTTEDGSISVLTMYNMDTEEEESTYISPEYIKNKVVADTRKKHKCSTRSGGANKEQQQTSDLGFNGVVDFRGGDSTQDGGDDDDDDDDDDNDCEEDDDESGSRSKKGDDDDDSPTVVSVALTATPVPTFIGDDGPSTLKKGGDHNDNSPIRSKKGGDDDDDNSEGKKQKHVRLLRLQSFCSKMIFSTCLHSLLFSLAPSAAPSESPPDVPSASPNDVPSTAPSESPSDVPSTSPSESPSDVPSASPNDVPSTAPSESSSDVPSTSPSESPSDVPSVSPSNVPSTSPSESPSDVPSTSPSCLGVC